MEVIYISWAGLGVFGIVAFLVMRAKEDRATRPQKSAIKPMFRNHRSKR